MVLGLKLGENTQNLPWDRFLFFVDRGTGHLLLYRLDGCNGFQGLDVLYTGGLVDSSEERLALHVLPLSAMIGSRSHHVLDSAAKPAYMTMCYAGLLPTKAAKCTIGEEGVTSDRKARRI